MLRWKTAPVIDVLRELKWRGLVAHSTDEAALTEHLGAGPVTFYVGFDPTAPSLHFGNLVQLMVARALQRAGHHPLLLVGGSTGLIGDPKDSGERVLNTKETVAGWVESIRRQVERFVDFSGANPARLVNNLDWTDAGAGLPARHRQALPRKSNARARRGSQPVGGRYLLHRVLLRLAAGHGFSPAPPDTRVQPPIRRE